MVKAKPVSKPKIRAKGEAGVSSHKKGQGFKRLDLPVLMCCECGEFVTDDAKAITVGRMCQSRGVEMC